uniref:Uncharacterized protein n=1 Tax=Opuntia streptacantha TaxID=393608 RepID=A0A7C9AZ16_OPUST
MQYSCILVAIINSSSSFIHSSCMILLHFSVPISLIFSFISHSHFLLCTCTSTNHGELGDQSSHSLKKLMHHKIDSKFCVRPSQSDFLNHLVLKNARSLAP